MIKTFGKITLAGILAALVMGVPVRASADDSTTNKPAPPVRARPPMFRGTLDAVDSTAKTITVANKTQPKRTFEITADTKFMKDGKPAILSDGVVGDPVSGSYTNSADGKTMIAKMITFGKPAPARKVTPPPPAPAPAN